MVKVTGVVGYSPELEAVFPHLLLLCSVIRARGQGKQIATTDKSEMDVEPDSVPALAPARCPGLTGTQPGPARVGFIFLTREPQELQFIIISRKDRQMIQKPYFCM